MKKLLAGAVIALACMLATACASTPALDPELQRLADTPPKVDLSDPQKAVESWWAIQDWSAAYSRAAVCDFTPPVAKPVDASYDRAAAAILSGGIAERFKRQGSDDGDCYNLWPDLARSLTRVEVESPERVIVEATIRNVTPIPSDVTLEASDKRDREYGQPTRYVVDRIDGAWRIVRIYHRPAPFAYEDANGELVSEEQDYVEDLTEESLAPSTYNFTQVSGY